jgi:hypothetical protein
VGWTEGSLGAWERVGRRGTSIVIRRKRIGLADLVPTKARIRYDPGTRAIHSPKRILARFTTTLLAPIRNLIKAAGTMLRLLRGPRQRARLATGQQRVCATGLNHNCQRNHRLRKRSTRYRLQRIRLCAHRAATKLYPRPARRQARLRFCLSHRDRGVCFSEVTKISVSFFVFLWFT